MRECKSTIKLSSKGI